MQGNIVNCQPDTRHFLTVETREGGENKSVLANIDGSPVMHNGLTYAGVHPDHVEVYLDTISGNHFAKITHSSMIALQQKGEKFYQGVGGVTGWFIPAPDFTINGRHGDKAKNARPAKVEPTTYGGPQPVAAAGTFPALAHRAAPRKSAKKAAKKAAKKE